MDLTQAENVEKLIVAKSVAAADVALAGLQACNICMVILKELFVRLCRIFFQNYRCMFLGTGRILDFGQIIEIRMH